MFCSLYQLTAIERTTTIMKMRIDQKPLGNRKTLPSVVR